MKIDATRVPPPMRPLCSPLINCGGRDDEKWREGEEGDLAVLPE